METILYNKPPTKSNNYQLRLLRVIISPKFTRLDFGYQATGYYVRGGWVTMNPKAFIRLKGSGKKLALTRVENIPLEPVKHNFKSTVESLNFSLFFLPVPNESLEFDFIEKEPVTPTLFNCYGITIDTKKGIPILTSNYDDTLSI